MTLHFHADPSDQQREALNRAHNATILAAMRDSNDDEIETLRTFIDELMAFAGVEDDEQTEALVCDNCGEVTLSISEDYMCQQCDADERGHTSTPTVGAWADHRFRDLDPRPVAEISEDAGQVKLAIGDHITEWMPVTQYTYKERK